MGPKKTICYARDRMKSNFSLAFLVLPKPQRKALTTLYRFCRTVDDIVDHAKEVGQAQVKLDHWKEVLERLPNPSLFDPIEAHQLAQTLRDFPIEREDLHWIIEGVETDLKKNRYQTFEELLTYCDGVASSVGLVCLAIFEADRRKTLPYAFAMGRALQLTNILRDIASDAQRGRIYIPLVDLERFGYRERHLLISIYDERFVELMKFQVNRVKTFYTQAKNSLSAKDRALLPACEIMRKTYESLLLRIEACQYNIFPKRIRISTARKMAVAMSVWAPRLLRAS